MPKLIEIERVIPQIIRVNQYIQKIVEKIVEVPTIIETLKEVVREQEKVCRCIPTPLRSSRWSALWRSWSTPRS